MKRKTKTPDYDDGRTIAEMNVDKKVNEEDKPTKKELRAMMRAGYLAYLPRVLATLAGFGLCVLLTYLWLNGWSF